MSDLGQKKVVNIGAMLNTVRQSLSAIEGGGRLFSGSERGARSIA